MPNPLFSRTAAEFEDTRLKWDHLNIDPAVQYSWFCVEVSVKWAQVLEISTNVGSPGVKSGLFRFLNQNSG